MIKRIRWSSLVLAALLCRVPAWALNASLDVSQYAHTSWALRGGALIGYPKSFAQTADGYLWLGTDSGVVRFDGVRFIAWEPPAGSVLPSASVVKLLASRDGALWIGTIKGLARWKDRELYQYPDLSGHYITTLVEDRHGTIWVGTTTGVGNTARLCAIRGFAVSCDARRQLGRYVISLYEDTRGTLWVGATTGLWRWASDPPTVYPMPDVFSEIHAITEDEHGSILVALNRDVKRLGDGAFEAVGLSATNRPLKPTALLRDRDGSLWIGTQDQGVVHLHQGRIDRLVRGDGLSGDFVVALFQDLEGNVWVGTLNGLDRFRDVAVATLNSKQNLWADTVVSVLATKDRSVWLGTVGGLNRWRDGVITRHSMPRALPHEGVASLFEDTRDRLWVSSSRGLQRLEDGRATTIMTKGFVHAIVEDDAESVWVSDQERGLIHLRNGAVVESIGWATFGGKNARALAIDPLDHGLWLGFFQGGLAYFKDGRIRASYAAADGLGNGPVAHLRIDADGGLWVATEGGLSRLIRGSIRTLTTRNGLPCDAVLWTMDDDTRALWLRSACGLMRVDRSEVDNWTVNPDRILSMTLYDSADGVPNHSEGSYSPAVARSADGRIWFASYDGAAVVDPRHLPFNAVAPPVHIEQVTADRKTYDPAFASPLPPLVRDLRIDFTALSLSSPEKVRFRYRLEGRDPDWVDAGNRRQAFYTDLPPRAYRFHVMASNNSGVWNQEGAVWSFAIQPAIYQTTLFRAASALLFLICAWALYRVRMKRFAAQLNVRFEERLAERTRIARDLHDTLLQGSLSASMQLHLLTDQLADHPVRSKLDRVLARLNQVNEEGRQIVEALRGQPALPDDLDLALVRAAEDFRGQHAVNIGVVVEGKGQPLHPLIRDEVYRIGSEALANAFRHARATRVDIELEYTPERLRVGVRDNGCGMTPTLAGAGRPGHWGMQGMRERAAHIGALLTVLSAPSAGTEIELLVPGHVAFRQIQRRTPRWYRRLWNVMRRLLRA